MWDKNTSDEVIPCGCGFDDVSFPHDCVPRKKKEDEEYLLGVSYKEAIDMINRNLNATYSLIQGLQERVLELEKEVDGLLKDAH